MPVKVTKVQVGNLIREPALQGTDHERTFNAFIRSFSATYAASRRLATSARNRCNWNESLRARVTSMKTLRVDWLRDAT